MRWWHRAAGLISHRARPRRNIIGGHRISEDGNALFTPLRYQATEADCYPTSLLNACVWLFEQGELPGAIVQHVYANCLDGIERGVTGSYTSRHAGLAVAGWLGDFRTGSFSVAVEILEGNEVHLRPRGGMLRWLSSGGVAVLDVCDTPTSLHSVLALSASRDYLDLWDPYLRGARYEYGRGALRLDTDGHSPNLRLARSRLDRRLRRPYALGPPADRVAVLIRRKSRRRPRRI